MQKMAIFAPKPWVNPFGKMSILRLFELLVWRFFVLEYRKQHFPGHNHGLTPLEECQFFDFLNFWFLQPKKAFFRSRTS